jgi:hypothetical protein
MFSLEIPHTAPGPERRSGDYHVEATEMTISIHAMTRAALAAVLSSLVVGCGVKEFDDPSAAVGTRTAEIQIMSNSDQPTPITPELGEDGQWKEPESLEVKAADNDLHELSALNQVSDNEVSFSHDGHTAYWACYGRFGSPPNNADICTAHLTGKFEDQQWSEAERLPEPINSPFNDREPKISMDGTHLWFQSDRPTGHGGFDVWVVYRNEDGSWGTPENLPFPINTPFNDHCLYFTDPLTETDAYMASNRPGTYGSNDLWHVTRDPETGLWSTPVNMGPNINSAGNEHMAMLDPLDPNRLIVTADRAGGMGGEDQWISFKQPDGSWGPLKNLGSPWNTPSHDRCGDWNMTRGMGQTMRSDNSNGFGSELYFVFASGRPLPAGPSAVVGLKNYYVRWDAVLQSLGL